MVLAQPCTVPIFHLTSVEGNYPLLEQIYDGRSYQIGVITGIISNTDIFRTTTASIGFVITHYIKLKMKFKAFYP